MGKKKNRTKTKEEIIFEEEEYLKFLKKRLDSDNYKENVTQEEYQKTRAKYDKAKLKLKFLKN